MADWGGRDPQFPERRLVTPSRLRHPEMMVVAYLVLSLIVGVFRNGLQLMGVASIYQVLITGILVIAAVSIDQLSHRRK